MVILKWLESGKHWSIYTENRRRFLSGNLRNISLLPPRGLSLYLTFPWSSQLTVCVCVCVCVCVYDWLPLLAIPLPPLWIFFVLTQTHAPDMGGNHKIPNKLWYSVVWFPNKIPQRLIAKQGLVHELLTYSWFIEPVMQSFHFQWKRFGLRQYGHQPAKLEAN